MKDKLIIFIGTLQGGGAERVVTELSGMYAEHFREVIILTYYDLPVFYRLDSRISLECVEKRTKSRNIIRNLLWIRKFVKREHPKLFLSFLLPFNILSIWSLLFTRIPVSVCERSDPQFVSGWLLILRNISYRFSNRIQVQTNAAKLCFPTSIQNKIVVIPNPNHISKAEREWSFRQKKDNRIVTVGRLIPVKNHRLLIEVFAVVNRNYPDVVLDIYGDGELKKSLQNQIDTLGLTEKIVLHGRINDITKHIASAKVFVLPSDLEGMPNALMEAMALGIPCVATDVSGVRDIITDRENGFIVPVGNKDEMVDRITKLLKSDELRNNFAENSINVISKFDKEKIFNQWLEFVS